jgi:hypothetical protein
MPTWFLAPTAGLKLPTQHAGFLPNPDLDSNTVILRPKDEQIQYAVEKIYNLWIKKAKYLDLSEESQLKKKSSDLKKEDPALQTLNSKPIFTYLGPDSDLLGRLNSAPKSKKVPYLHLEKTQKSHTETQM